MKILPASLLPVLLASCSSPVVPVAPDMGPVGDGLKVIGYALIAVAVVITVGRNIR